MKVAATDLPSLLSSLDPHAPLAQRHLWLIQLLDWVRGSDASVSASAGRVQLFIDAVESRPEVRQRLQQWWEVLADSVDITPLLADYGFAPRTGLASELAERLQAKAHGVVSLVSRCEATGLVRRQRSSDDKRRVEVSLTAKGTQQLEQLALLHQPGLRALQTVLNDITAAQALIEGKNSGKISVTFWPAEPSNAA